MSYAVTVPGWICALKAGGPPWPAVAYRRCSPQRAQLRRGQRQNYLTTPAPCLGPLEWTGILPSLAGAARGKETIMCPVPGDDVTPSVIPGHRPSRHSGPGYVANPEAPDFELDGPLRDATARWLNLVPAEHRHDGRESAKDALETLGEHTRSCPDHPLGALLGGPSPPEGSGARGPDRVARARLGGAVVARPF